MRLASGSGLEIISLPGTLTNEYCYISQQLNELRHELVAIIETKIVFARSVLCHLEFDSASCIFLEEKGFSTVLYPDYRQRNKMPIKGAKLHRSMTHRRSGVLVPYPSRSSSSFDHYWYVVDMQSTG
jgi:hypothetical protein